MLHPAQLHAQLLTNTTLAIAKPLVLEEFGLTWWKMTPEDQRVLFQVQLFWSTLYL